MKETLNPHDQLLKKLLDRLRAIIDFLRYYLPEDFVRLILPETAERIEDSFVDEDLKEHFSDMLFRVELKAGGEAFIYVLLEHKSSPDPWVALQLLRYIVRIWEKARLEGSKKLPLVFPVVFYHGKAKWRVSKRFSALLDFVGETKQLKENMPEFSYHLCDLSEVADEDLKGDAQLQGGMRLLKYIFRPELHEQIEAAFRVVMERTPEAGMKEQVMVFIHYLLKTGKATEREIGRVVRRINEAKGAEIMETAYDRILNEGVQLGLQQGLQEGLQQGLQEGLQEGLQQGLEGGSQQTALKMTLRLLRKRFGRIESRTEAKVVRLSTEKLEELGEALLDFEKPQDLKAWLKEHAAK